jgi:membrane peptidoglycan carboxypeptidase
MADVYATLADGGYRNTPIAITKVVFPGGHVDTNWGKPRRVKVLSDGVTAEETDILHQNVLGGTAVRSAITCPTAAKTGTTSDLKDAWLDGYTPNYSTSVWMGYPNKNIPMTDVHGEPQQGGYLPAEIWHAYMAAVTEGEPPCAEFPSPKEQISYEPFFGKFASTGSSSSVEEGNESESESEKKHKPKSTTAKPPVVESPSGGNEKAGGESHEAPSPHVREPVEPTHTPEPRGPAPTVGGAGGAEPPKH